MQSEGQQRMLQARVHRFKRALSAFLRSLSGGGYRPPDPQEAPPAPCAGGTFLGVRWVGSP
eukprot:1918144-Alexandrium_andersonii.AAC.1